MHTKGEWRIGDARHTVFGPPNGDPSPEIIAHLGRNFRGNGKLIQNAPVMAAMLADVLTDLRIQATQTANERRMARCNEIAALLAELGFAQ